MKTFIACVLSFFVGAVAVAAFSPTRPPDCGCKDCEKEKKCQPRCFCAPPLQ